MSEKAIFLDRDDTLIEDQGYINNPEQVRLLPGVPQALIELRSMGYKLIVVSNQSAVARGIVTEKVLGQIHDRLRELLAEQAVLLDNIYYCPCHPDGSVAKYRKESDLRKPNPGMLLKAAEEMDIDLGRSWMVGNSHRDIEAGSRAGCKTVLIMDRSHDIQAEPDRPRPDYTAVNMKEAVNIIKRYQRSPGNQQPPVGRPCEAQVRPATENEEHPEEPEPPDLHIQAQQPQSRADKSEPRPEPQMQPPESKPAGIEKTLNEILDQLRRMHRTDMFGEFSVMRFLAGAVQITVLFCLLIAVWFLVSPPGLHDKALLALAFAAVLQLMSLTFYIMHNKR